MTLEPSAEVQTIEVGSMGSDTVDEKEVPKPQVIVRGPVAAILPIKHLGTNGGGFFGANSAHPYENPSAWSNYLECVSILIFPFSLIVMFGRMLNRMRHAVVIYGVMLTLFAAMMIWAIHEDALKPNPAIARQEAMHISVPANGETPIRTACVTRGPGWTGQPGRQRTSFWTLGRCHVFCRHHGRDMRFGELTSDSLNPLAGLTPMTGMMLNCVFGGKGVGLINMLVYLIVGVFLAGLMVGRTPEYLGKKVEARDEACHAGAVDPSDTDPGTNGSFRRAGLGQAGDQQPRRAWLFGDPLRVCIGIGEQWLRLRRSGRHPRL